MQPVSVVAFFCEDIREEKSGQDIIIGVFPDNLNLTPSGPSEGAGTTVITKLGLYVRLHFDVNDTPPRQISARLVNADGTDIQLPGWTPEIIKKAFSDAKANGLSLAGLIMKAVASPYMLRGSSGKVSVIINIDGTDYIAGMLNLITVGASDVPPPS